MSRARAGNPDPPDGRTERSFKGVVAAGDQQTAEAAATILRRGGNAVDAAVAAAFASFVAEMTLVNIGGGGVALVYTARDRQTTSYDFFGDMPSGGYDPARADFKRILVDFGAATQPFYIGRASVAVPGAVTRPRVHFEAGVLQLEGGIAPDVAAALRRAGYEVNHWPERSMYFGGVHTVGVFEGQFLEVGDGRRGGVGLFVG